MPSRETSRRSSDLYSPSSPLNPIPTSHPHYWLFILFPLCPHSYGTKEILVAYLAFIPPVNSLSSPFPSLIVNLQNQETHSKWKSQ